MIIYMCMEFGIQYTFAIKRYHPETIFRTETKGHDSDNNWWILSVFELELYFVIIYKWIQYTNEFKR